MTEPSANNLRKCPRCPSLFDPTTKDYKRCFKCRETAREGTANRRRLEKDSARAVKATHPSSQDIGVVRVTTKARNSEKRVNGSTSSAVGTIALAGPQSPHPETPRFSPSRSTFHPVDPIQESPPQFTGKSIENFNLDPKRFAKGVNNIDSVPAAQETSHPLVPTRGMPSVVDKGIAGEEVSRALLDTLRAPGVIGCLLLAQPTENGVQYLTFGDPLSQRTLLPVFKKLVADQTVATCDSPDITPAHEPVDPASPPPSPSHTPSLLEKPSENKIDRGIPYLDADGIDRGKEEIPSAGSDEYNRLMIQKSTSGKISGRLYTIRRGTCGMFLCLACQKYARRRGPSVFRHMKTCLALTLEEKENLDEDGAGPPAKKLKLIHDKGDI
ncbi:hypothetical protein C8R43DRAFT_1110371 [Mycena crocata]|nr:hypothetical protein C8R43DRAFT_1110371 [Mycena crocata]